MNTVSSTPETHDTLLRMEGIYKSFPGVQALSDSQFELCSAKFTHWWVKMARENRR